MSQKEREGLGVLVSRRGSITPDTAKEARIAPATAPATTATTKASSIVLGVLETGTRTYGLGVSSERKQTWEPVPNYKLLSLVPRLSLPECKLYMRTTSISRFGAEVPRNEATDYEFAIYKHELPVYKYELRISKYEIPTYKSEPPIYK